MGIGNGKREPIHIPGVVQPHGVQLAHSKPALKIARVSANTGEKFGLLPRNLLGNPREVLT